MKKLCMILPLALILCFMVGCQDKEAMAELEEFRAQAAVEEQNKALVRKILAEFDNNKNGDFMDEICTSDYKCHTPSNAEPINIKEHIEYAKAAYTAFPDHSHTIESIYADGDVVIVQEIFRGTHQGDFMGIAPTGNKYEFSGIAIFRFSDGKWAEYWADGDQLGFMQQLGMELKPKEEK